MKPRITLITGSPGTGKSTVSANVANLSVREKSIHLHTDDFYHYLKKGAVLPHLPEAQKQNEVVTDAIVKTARHFAESGYDVVVDGIIGPWFIKPWEELALAGIEVNYFILRATKEETLRRAVTREKLSDRENATLVEQMWGQFSQLGNYEAHVIETTDLTIDQTVTAVLHTIGNPPFLLSYNSRKN
ncbi:hypothetical protein IGI37_003798 [Enterococcus sp. AZ194]|uniref:zeta toxin family protein n=1 Tax=Enterococcus sp. AZ194 TaxID=2774629 RepID=UPI003F2131A2